MAVEMIVEERMTNVRVVDFVNERISILKKLVEFGQRIIRSVAHLANDGLG